MSWCFENINKTSFDKVGCVTKRVFRDKSAHRKTSNRPHTALSIVLIYKRTVYKSESARRYTTDAGEPAAATAVDLLFFVCS